MLPGMQFKQLLLPVKEYFPGGHFWQASLPAAAKVPPGHGSQVEVPGLGAMDPAGHLVHVLFPPKETNPLLQGLQDWRFNS